MPYQYLHIGKTGGTLIREVLESLPEPHHSQFVFHGHRVRLVRALREHPEMPVFFSVRRPETLFVSAFNSRLREGKPRYSIPRRVEEEAVFARFRSPNELAEALSAVDHELQQSAETSMASIRHIHRGLVSTLGGVEVLERHRESIVFILLQERLEQDLREFLARIDVPLELARVSPAERIHTSMPGDETMLSELGLANLKQWYRSHQEIYNWCVEQHDRLLDAG
jgi:hypothetical protein